MAIHLNLLHEEIQEHRQRQRDPLKIGMMALSGFGALLLLYYLWNAYQTLEIKSHLSAVQRDWAKEEPKVTAAQKRSAELTGIINTTKTLDGTIEGRFYWAPLLEKISRCVAPNTQLTALDGTVLDENKGIGLTIEGVAAGREPRAAAEDLRQLLLEQLAASYHDVKVEFKTLEDLDTLANIGGSNMPMARYTLTVSFNPSASGGAPAPAPARSEKKMTLPKFTKDQIQKIGLSSIGFVALLYVYFNFFLGPLNTSRATMTATIHSLEGKLGSSKSELAKAAKLEQQAGSATGRFATMKSLSPEGAPIAWFPPRIKAFFANEKIEKANARLETSGAYKQPELAGWSKYTWNIDIPEADFAQLGKAISDLENTEPLLSIIKLSIHEVPNSPEFQQVNLSVTTAIIKR